MNENSALKTGDKIEGKYRITGLLGSDPLSHTYEAVQIFSGDRLVLKQARQKTDEDAEPRTARSPLERQFELMKKLEHPSVPVAMDFFSSEDVDYLIRQFRSGQPLSQLVKTHMDLDRVRDISGQILGAIDEIHRKGFIYLGLSPDSVLVDENNQVSLVHFSFARAMGERVDPEEARLIDSDYMAPEVAEFESVNSRADIFSFGALLFFMLTGKTIAVLEDTGDLKQYDMGWELSNTIINCIFTDPVDRYPDIRKLREDLFASQSLDMPSFAVSDPGNFTNIGQIRGGYHNQDKDQDYQNKIIKILLFPIVAGGIMAPLMPMPLSLLAGVMVLACFIGAVVVKNTSFFHYEIGELGFTLKGPGQDKAYSWSQVIKFTRRKGGFRVTAHLVNGKKLFIRTEDLDSLVDLLRRISGRPVIEIDRLQRKNLFHDDDDDEIYQAEADD